MERELYTLICTQNNDFVKITVLGDNLYLVTFTKKNCNDDKKIVKATKNDCYFNRYGCILYRK